MKEWLEVIRDAKYFNLLAPDTEHAAFMKELRGPTNMFSNVYFSDAEDEFCYVTEFLRS